MQTSNRGGERSLDSLHYLDTQGEIPQGKSEVLKKVGYHLVFLVTIFVKKRDSLRSLTHFTPFFLLFSNNLSRREIVENAEAMKAVLLNPVVHQQIRYGVANRDVSGQ